MTGTTTVPYLEGRAPARILEPGTFPMPGMPGVEITYGHGHDCGALELVSELLRHPVLAVDIETEGLGKRAWYLKVVSVAVQDHVVLFDPRDPSQYRALADVLNGGAKLVLHNSAFDIPPLHLNGLISKETILSKILDTLLYARMAEPDEKTSRSLSACSARYLGWSTEDTVTRRAKNLGVTKSRYFEIADLSSPAYRWDAATDALATFRLLPVVRQAAYDRTTKGHPFTKYGATPEEARELIENPQIRNRRYLARSSQGYLWDPEYLDAYRLGQAKDNSAAEAELAGYGIRPGNAQDLVKFLDSSGEIPAGYPRTATGLIAGDKTNLVRLHHPLAKTFIALKESRKIDHDYLSKAAELSDHNGRIHPSLNVLGAASTGRDSITGFPLQQLNHAARQIFLEDYPGAGVVSVDWSQQEPALAANLAGDTSVLERYENPANKADMYEIISEFAGTVRKDSKWVMLAQMYGQGLVLLALNLGLITPLEAALINAQTNEINPDTITPEEPRGRTYWPREAAQTLGIPGLERAVEIKDKVQGVMPKTFEYVTKVKGVANQYGCVVTWAGRILTIPMASFRGQWKRKAHKGPNSVIQGGAADMLDYVVREAEARGLGDTLMFPMHDEVVVHRDAAPEWERIMQKAPERMCWVTGRTPVFRTDSEDLGERWGKPE